MVPARHAVDSRNRTGELFLPEQRWKTRFIITKRALMQSTDTLALTPRSGQPAWLVYALFFVATAAAASVGALFAPGAWYAGLAKPSWNPPNWVFAPVWTMLYVMIAIAGARAWSAGAGSRSGGFTLDATAWTSKLKRNWPESGCHRAVPSQATTRRPSA